MGRDTKLEMIKRQGKHKNARIKIGITIYNDFEYLAMLLQSIRLYTYIKEPYDVVVCDDCSRDDMREKARAVCAEYGAVFLEHDKNMGVAASWNHLVLSLNRDAEIIVILNNDILVVPNWLRVGVHFSDTNKDNPQIGSCFWQPVNRVSKDMMRLFLPTLGSTTYITKDTVTNDSLGFVDTRHVDARVGEFQGIGKCMAPAGCSFLVRRSVFEEVGMFDERYKAFFEESDWGTQCAVKGRAAFGFAYPRPYHTHAGTFSDHPELGPIIMPESRALYRKKWGVQDGRPDFDDTHEKFMSQIPKTKVKFLQPTYDPPYEEIKSISLRPGGEVIQVPRLIEIEEEV